MHKCTINYCCLQVKFAVFLAYMKSVGLILSLLILFLYLLNNAASIYANIWLSEWSDDVRKAGNDTAAYNAQRDMRLGVYGALGLAQGKFIILNLENKFLKLK